METNTLSSCWALQGTVKSYDRESKYYRVVYEDEDSEDLSETELERLVEAASQEALKPAKPLLQAGEDLQAGADIDNNCQSNPVAGEQTNKVSRKGGESKLLYYIRICRITYMDATPDLQDDLRQIIVAVSAFYASTDERPWGNG